MAESRLTIGINLKRNASFQWTNFNFNSMAVVNGVPIAANEDGLYSLFDADDDDGTNIDAFFELATTDFGTIDTKRVRFMYFTSEASGDLKVVLTADEDDSKEFLVKARKIGQAQHRNYRVNGRRDIKGTHLMFRVENTKGCDFSVDTIEVALMNLGPNR